MKPIHKFNGGRGATLCNKCSVIICTGLTKDLYCIKCKPMAYSESLYDYVFHYNPYEKRWSAIPRDKYNQYWSSKKVDGVLSSTKYETLIELISKGDEFINSIE